MTVTDGNGCTVTKSSTVTVNTLPTLPEVTATDNTNCEGDPNGTITFAAGTGLEYSIDGGTTYQASNQFTGLAADTYTTIVRNATSPYFEK